MKRSEQGFVLICVLWVLAILTVITLGYGQRAVLARRAAAYSIDQLQAQCMARGCVQRGLVELTNAMVVADDRGSHQQGAYFLPRWFDPVDVLAEGVYAMGQAPDFAGERCHFVIEDEGRRISVNRAPRRILEEIEALDFATLEAILRRRGEDGSEDRAQPFLVLEELRASEGIAGEEWYGVGDQPGLRDLLTCWGDDRINVNTASEAVLRCIPKLDDDVIQALVTYRAGPDGRLGTRDDQAFASLDVIAKKIDVSRERVAPLYAHCKVRSEFFTITGFATRRQGKVRGSCSATVHVWAGDPEVIQWQEGPFGS